VTSLPAGVGVGAAIAHRAYMEDRWAAHATVPALFAAVYDGHGGAEVAERAAADLHPLVFQALAAGVEPADALRRAFEEVDRRTSDIDSGSTAAAVLITRGTLFTAHAGDSRVVRVGRSRAESLTRDHRIDVDPERARVLRMGAELDPPYVVREGRGLMVTRSLGDSWFRPVGVIAEPEIGAHAPTADDLAIVLATDGVWDVLDAEDVGTVVRRAGGAQAAADAVIRAALDAGTRDNVTAVVVRLADLELAGPIRAERRPAAP
jgi:serine/threonine protein phosphatase PrpC